MNDLISRQAAIEALRTCYDTETISMDNGDEYINYGDAVGEIEHLPSAQPEKRTEERTETHACDCIDREAAIDALDEIETEVADGLGFQYEKWRKYFSEMPSAQPDPQWIPTKVKPDPDLPEDDMSGYFLVTLHTYGNIGFNMDEYEVKKMRWDRVNGWGFPVHSPAWIEEALTQEVLAWKPCPEPYRGDGVE